MNNLTTKHHDEKRKITNNVLIDALVEARIDEAIRLPRDLQRKLSQDDLIQTFNISNETLPSNMRLKAAELGAYRVRTQR
jgi:hypothetical protein